MDASQIKSLLINAFPDAEVEVSLEGSHCNVSVISDRFAGMRPVARQQSVYAPLSQSIASGSIHAVNIRAKTPNEAL